MFRIKRFSKSRVFYFSLIAAICLAFVGAVVLPKQKAEAQGQRREKKKYQPAPHAPTNQTVYAPLIDLPGQTEAEIVINNRSSHNMEINPTFYSTSGQAFAASPMTLKPAEVRYFAIADLLPRGLNRNQAGGVALSYQGSIMEVAAQLTLLGKERTGNADVTLYGAMDYRSTTQEAVWWMPNKGTATMILGNSSNLAISASLKFANGETREIKLDPYATEVVTRRDVGRPIEGVPDSVRIEVAGPVGSLRAAGFVAAQDGRIISNIRYYDPQNIRQPHLFATRLNVKGNSLRLVLKNTGDAAITARPRFLPVSGDNSATVELHPVAINPHQAVEVDLKPLVTAANGRNDLDVVSVQVTNDGANGSLIGALSGVNQTKKTVYDTPLRDIGPLRNSTGSYPWRLDGDYSTVISITNVGSEPAGFTATIKHESGKYMPQARILAVGETATFDLNKIRDEQIPDKDGNTLPKTAKMGQVHWSVLRGGDTVRLIGRGEMTSAARQVSSSYSCPVCCPDSFSELVASPNSPVILQNGFAEVYVDGIWLDCYNNIVGPYWYPYAVSWWCEDPAVVSFTTNGWPYTYNANGLLAGYTLTEASTTDVYYFDDGMDCYSTNFTYTDPDDAMVIDFTVAHDKSATGIRPSGIIAGLNGADPPITTAETQATVTVTVTPPTSGVNVALSVVSEEGGHLNVGGHIDHTGVRPVGTLSQSSGTTNQSGIFTAVYTASQFSGVHRIRATVNSVTKEVGIGIFINGLQELPAGTNYDKVGQTATHPFNHWGTAIAVANLPPIADDYKAAYPGSANLRFNDMSLVSGGRFEIDGNWVDTSHAEHRVGRNCDIGSSNVPTNRWATLNQIFFNNEVISVNNETACCNHWHVRFRP
ncbi:MAG: hypothetical protein SF097_01400 [Acidobacteriota bacterium]|nr:hypothetical protein [Acidobacteriota bacterium]